MRKLGAEPLDTLAASVLLEASRKNPEVPIKEARSWFHYRDLTLSDYVVVAPRVILAVAEPRHVGRIVLEAEAIGMVGNIFVVNMSAILRVC